MGRELTLYTVLEGEAIYCISCPNKGPLKGNKNYAKCGSCAGTYRPSCAERADLREDGSFRECCQKLANSSNGMMQNVDEEEDLASDENTRRNQDTNELLSQMHRLIKNELKKTTARINSNIDNKTDAIASKIDSLNERVDELETDISGINSRVTVLESAKQNDKIEMNDNLTQTQEQFIQNLMQKLGERKKAGEKDIEIKYINGTPSVKVPRGRNETSSQRLSINENKLGSGRQKMNNNGFNGGSSQLLVTSQLNNSSATVYQNQSQPAHLETNRDEQQHRNNKKRLKNMNNTFQLQPKNYQQSSTYTSRM
ncbi:hypothetical protein QAD02_001202 [Eretmocerus hayati]|uniref:Uncharacterized protein n=1 Tax=Eretmocerus hayati TaxID=131215 RepID=A0ACC2NGC1_9HYME|nr:hypothetical protein QAD02_001202 [Eretmocerus hayati]